MSIDALTAECIMQGSARESGAWYCRGVASAQYIQDPPGYCWRGRGIEEAERALNNRSPFNSS